MGRGGRGPTRGRLRCLLDSTALAFACASLGVAARAQSVEDVQGLSISELTNLKVSSATKTDQPLSDAPAALYVITHDEIIRSGAATLPEALRLAPNLFVAQTSAHSWVITARGFAGNLADQAFANKLLVLIDGRSVYNPLFSGVDWDAQDVVLSDVDRIEVISGPGATLWGANAVNGVINIITRKSYETQGGLVEATAASNGEGLTVRYGGRVSDDLTYRAYVKDLAVGDTVTATGADAKDHFAKPQGGFQLDWTPGASDALTLSGDAYDGEEAQAAGPDANLNGFNLNGRWDHQWRGGGDLSVQSWFNREARGADDSGGTPYAYDSYDLEAQQNFPTIWRQSIVVGAGVRDSAYHLTPISNFFYQPSSGHLLLTDIFGQDTVALASSLDLILGLKLEDDPYSGLSTLPSARLTWRASSELFFWASAQKAIRSPTPFDTAAKEELPGTSSVFLEGAPDFLPEKLTTYEVGLRAEPFQRASISISGFYNDYDNLRTIEFSPGPSFPLQWGNQLAGQTLGMEAWADFQVASWWRLSGGLDLLEKHLTFKPGASGLLGVAEAGDDPRTQAQARSAMNLGPNVTLDADLRYVAALPDPALPAYTELNLSLTWNATRHVQLVLAGFNLLQARHLEFVGGTEVPRTGAAELRWRF
jgi:iron complex outermembrane recepter protein